MTNTKNLLRTITSTLLGAVLLLGAVAGVLAGFSFPASAAVSPYATRLTSTQNPPSYVTLGQRQVYLESYAQGTSTTAKIVFKVTNTVTGVAYTFTDTTSSGGRYSYATTSIPASACGQRFTAKATQYFKAPYSYSPADSATHAFKLNCGPQLIIKGIDGGVDNTADWGGKYFTPGGKVSVKVNNLDAGTSKTYTVTASTSGTISLTAGPCNSSATATDLASGKTTGAYAAKRTHFFPCVIIL